ncbi:phage transcriptional activator, RinA family/phage transcriptional regulator, ArpU family [Paenibacillus algorifonticola]|uniref:Phage transcriptional activator, RinA family/phage transcriptional regulator, ArpU family n=1 Tax=Paenibacillus algorifonticola TaxID=684063 RepID=A0A1I2H0K5_9BACL|nr:ArpU family phage packaging/lysis transcriptional regulator [Paenibacillus algorifonticola]SFF22829.1 phage transcriptional activator, RinA family/phage transcriptional regulator, ArpU family [Paenibacillus algorifonticola]
MTQLQFPWEIDREATREAVEQRLESARLFAQLGFIRRETKMTSSPEPRFHGATNVTSSPVEDTATYNVDTEQRLEKECEQVQQVISRLGKLERQLIQKRYMEDGETFDYNVYSELHLSERKYYRIKSNAIYKLAFALRLERYVD